jgi:hypothetical protein
MHPTSTPKPQGFILAIVAVFGAVFLTIGLGLAGYLLAMQHAEEARVENEQSLAIAEAGLNYYAWHLAHYPSDLQDGTGGSGPYVHQYQDPEGGTAGSYSLSIDGHLQCGSPTVIDITSVGSTAKNPLRKATVVGRYARPSVANYSYVFNTNTWAGAALTVFGRMHSNGGIHMDGNNLSTVESSVSTWSCTSTYGCSPTATKAGVFGTGTNPALWVYPTPQMDFNSISANLSSIKTAAQSGGGLYFAARSGAADQRGYHMVFKSNGTFDMYAVTSTVAASGFNPVLNAWTTEHNIIGSETLLGNYTIPSSCGAVFVEDRLWAEGTVKGKVTVAAADLTGGGTNPDVMLANNISYAAYDGTNGLTLIAAGNLVLPLNSPNDLTIHGIYAAQNGAYIRDYYYYAASDSFAVPSQYSSYVTRNSLTLVGSIVSRGSAVTSWGSPVTSGYVNRSTTYDGTLASNPPPFTPYTSSQYSFVLWNQR